MEKFIDYIEKSLPDRPGDSILFQFKRKILDEMNALDKTVQARGLKDEKVRSDLIISEYPDLPAAFAAFYAEKNSARLAKRKLLVNAVGSVVYILLLTAAFLAVSFATQDWGRTWVIMADGILLWIDYLLILGIIKLTSMRRVFHYIARVLLALGVMVFSVAAFLLCMAVFRLPESWLIIIGGVAGIFAADSVYIAATKSKLAVIFYLAYIPAFAAMAYIICGAAGLLPWSPGWMMIPLSLIADAVVIAALIIRNKRIAREVAEHWNED